MNFKAIKEMINAALREVMPPELIEAMPGDDPVITIIGGLRETVQLVQQHERRLRAHDRSTDAIFQRIEDLERAVQAYIDSPKEETSANLNQFYVGMAYKDSFGFTAINYDKMPMNLLPRGEYEIYLKLKKEG